MDPGTLVSSCCACSAVFVLFGLAHVALRLGPEIGTSRSNELKTQYETQWSQSENQHITAPPKVCLRLRLYMAKSSRENCVVLGNQFFGCCKVEGKATAKWKRILFVGKTEPHDTYILSDGSDLVLTRSVRRIDVNWKSHLKYYNMFSHWSWEYISLGMVVEFFQPKVPKLH